MKPARRFAAPELTLSASSAILALLTFAASVSAMTAGALPPQVLAGVLIVTVDACGGIEEIVSAGPVAVPAVSAISPSESVVQSITSGPEPLAEHLTNLPPPAV